MSAPRWGALLAGVLALGSVSAHAKGGGERTHCTGVVNLNEATVAQLDGLPGVGLKAAQHIIEQRQKRPFKRVEELVRVKGFGKKRFLRIKPYLTLQGATTLQVEPGPEPAKAVPPAPPGAPAATH